MKIKFLKFHHLVITAEKSTGFPSENHPFSADVGRYIFHEFSFVNKGRNPISQFREMILYSSQGIWSVKFLIIVEQIIFVFVFREKFPDGRSDIRRGDR